MGGRRVPVEVRAEACREVAAGRPAGEVAASLGVSASTVRRWTARAAAVRHSAVRSYGAGAAATRSRSAVP